MKAFLLLVPLHHMQTHTHPKLKSRQRGPKQGVAQAWASPTPNFTVKSPTSEGAKGGGRTGAGTCSLSEGTFSRATFLYVRTCTQAVGSWLLAVGGWQLMGGW